MDRGSWSVIAIATAVVATSVGLGYSLWTNSDGSAPVAAASIEPATVATPDLSQAVVTDERGDAMGEHGAAPWLDIRSVAVRAVDEDSFLLEMTLAELPSDWEQVTATPGFQTSFGYDICWEPDPTLPTRCATLELSPRHGAPYTMATYLLFAEECSAGLGLPCGWTIPVTLLPGNGGRILFDVPFDHATFDGTDPVITNLRGYTSWYHTTQELPQWHWAYSVGTPGDHRHGHGGIPAARGLADETATAAVATTLGEATFDGFDVATTALIDAGPGVRWGADGTTDLPEMDLLAFDLEEVGGAIRATITVAGMEELPAYAFHYDIGFTIPGEDVFELGVRQDNNAGAYGFVGQCIGAPCHTPWMERLPVEIEFGAPATLVIEFPRAFLGDDLDGTPILLMFAMTMRAEYSLLWGDAGDDLHVDWHAMSIIETHEGGHPFVFGDGHKTAEIDGHEHGH